MAVPQVLTEEQVQSFRQTICRAATELLVDRGYDGVTMRAIADAAGCSRMTPYRYFADKDEILVAIRATALVRLADIVDHAVADEPDPVTRLERIAGAYLRIVREEPQTYRLGFEFAFPDVDIHPALAEHVERVRRPLLDAVRDCLQLGLIQGDVATVGHLFWAGIHGLISLHISNKLTYGRSFDRLYMGMVRTLFRGVAAGPPDEPRRIPRPPFPQI